MGGRNYCWSRLEGTHSYNPAVACNSGVPTLPILQYDHSTGDCAIIGGYRYRGTQVPTLLGYYVYGDFCSGRIWGGFDLGNGSWSTAQLLDTPLGISAFGEDEAGELYVADLVGGVIYQIVAGIPNQPDITVSPLSVAFGTVTVGSMSASKVVAVRNDGTAALSLGTLSLGGTNAGDFRKVTGGDRCSGRVLAPGTSCTVSLRFRPGSAGPKSAALVVPSNDPDENPTTVALAAIGRSFRRF